MVADVTCDGVLDVVGRARLADTGAVLDTGKIYVWAGQTTPTGTPTTTLTVSGALAGDQLGYIGAGQGLLCCDVTGDGTLDVVAGAYLADVGGTTDTGAIYVWDGGTFWPMSRLTVPGAVAFDRLGN